MALSYVTLALVKARLGITNTTDDTVLQSLCDQVNGFIESYCHRAIGPWATGSTFTFHVEDEDTGWSRVFPFPGGVSSITLLEVAPYTGAAFVTVPAADYFLMPSAQSGDRDNGWPATEIHMTDIPSASNGQPFFATGYNTVRITGNYGWTAIPYEAQEVALNLTLALWRSRSAGTSDVFTIGPEGERTFERALSDKDRHTLMRYQSRTVTFV